MRDRVSDRETVLSLLRTVAFEVLVSVRTTLLKSPPPLPW